MATKSGKKSGHVWRIILISLAWAAWVFLTLACVSFRAPDPTNSAASPIYYAHNAGVHNWCGPVGADLAFFIFNTFGPGALIGLVMLAAVLIVWTFGRHVHQLTLRLIGGAILVVVVSGMTSLINFGRDLPAGAGGLLGAAIGHFLKREFNYLGAALILALGLVVGLLLAVDEIVLALPGLIARGFKKMPAEQVVDVAGGAAVAVGGGLAGALKTLAEKIFKPSPRPAGAAAGRKASSRVRANPEAASPVVDAAASAGKPQDATPAESSPAPIPAPPKRAEPIVRKPRLPAIEPMLPFKAPSPQKQDLGNYRLPGLDLLDEAEPVVNDGQEDVVREKARVLEGCLTSFGIDAKVVAIDTGPVVTLYELELAPGIKSSQVAALHKDIARSLMSPPVRIIDNIPGKSTMGIEAPNTDKEKVRLRELMQLGHDRINKMALPMCLGKDASGNPLIEDLAAMPHLLIAGTTGSGKSVCINSIIMTLLLTQRPDHVKLIMVDPKMVEMQDYKQIPHLMAPIIDDMAKAEGVLEWATEKMDERYQILAEAGVRHIKQFNKLSREQIVEAFKPATPDEEARLLYHMPYIVIIIDELADLMMTSKEVEGHIVRIAQKARAVGIHLLLATQRPEAQVVTGLIKSNMPGRICFQVRSRIDSRIMLDQSGGELLLGQGDLLMLRPSGGSLLRGQGAFVSDEEIKKVCRFLSDIAQPEYHPELMQLGAPKGLAEAEKDEFFDKAVEIILETQRGSVSLLQRHLTIGYSRASRIMEQMRAMGIVGEYKGSQASEVLMTRDQWDAYRDSQRAGALPPAEEPATDAVDEAH